MPRIVNRSPYEPSPYFFAANPLFSNKLMVRHYFMQGLISLMDESERFNAVRREIKDCIADANPSKSPLDFRPKM